MAGEIGVQGNQGIRGSLTETARPQGSRMEAVRVALGDAPTTAGRLARGSTEAQNNCRENMALQAA